MTSLKPQSDKSAHTGSVQNQQWHETVLHGYALNATQTFHSSSLMHLQEVSMKVVVMGESCTIRLLDAEKGTAYILACLLHWGRLQCFFLFFFSYSRANEKNLNFLLQNLPLHTLLIEGLLNVVSLALLSLYVAQTLPVQNIQVGIELSMP